MPPLPWIQSYSPPGVPRASPVHPAVVCPPQTGGLEEKKRIKRNILLPFALGQVKRAPPKWRGPNGPGMGAGKRKRSWESRLCWNPFCWRETRGDNQSGPPRGERNRGGGPASTPESPLPAKSLHPRARPDGWESGGSGPADAAVTQPPPSPPRLRGERLTSSCSLSLSPASRRSLPLGLSSAPPGAVAGVCWGCTGALSRPPSSISAATAGRMRTHPVSQRAPRAHAHASSSGRCLDSFRPRPR